MAATQRQGIVIDDFGGKGEVLVLVHGLGGSSNTWYPEAQVLKRDLHVLAYDLAGAGRSPLGEAITVARHVADLMEVIRGAGAERVHLGGHSFGTIICQHFAALYPGQVASLALLGAFPAPPAAARGALKERAAKVRAEGMHAIADAIVAGGISQDSKVNQPAVAAFVRECIMAQTAEGYARNCEALAAAEPADLTRIKCPVLLLTGEEDRTAPVDVARAMASALAQATVAPLAGCGHWAPIERAKQVNYALTVFYARQRNHGRAAS
ncbi:MAG: alpha/beta fold hydrolase [Acetobacteraceae bacterium]